MKNILCYICTLSLLFMITGCADNTKLNIAYDNINLYVTPVMNAAPGDIVPIKVNAKEGASFLLYVNQMALSPHDVDEYFITYEFVMPTHDVTITHTVKEEPEMNDITIPASMTTYRISYTTDYNFNDKYQVIRNQSEADTLFAGFTLMYNNETISYPEDFFENNLLIAFLQHEGSGSVGHSLHSATLKNDTLTITVNREVPAIGTCDMASWLCVVSVSKNMLPDNFTVDILTQERKS